MGGHQSEAEVIMSTAGVNRSGVGWTQEFQRKRFTIMPLNILLHDDEGQKIDNRMMWLNPRILVYSEVGTLC